MTSGSGVGTCRLRPGCHNEPLHRQDFLAVVSGPMDWSMGVVHWLSDTRSIPGSRGFLTEKKLYKFRTKIVDKKTSAVSD